MENPAFFHKKGPFDIPWSQNLAITRSQMLGQSRFDTRPAITRTKSSTVNKSESVASNNDDMIVNVSDHRAPRRISSLGVLSSLIGEPLIRNIGLHYSNLTRLQQYSLPILLRSRNLHMCSSSRLESTGAFLIAAVNAANISRLCRSTELAMPSVIILIQSLGIAESVFSEVNILTKETGLCNCAIVSGTDIGRQIALLSGGVDVLITTPKMLLKLLKIGRVGLSACAYILYDSVEKAVLGGSASCLLKINSEFDLSQECCKVAFTTLDHNEKVTSVINSLLGPSHANVSLGAHGSLRENVLLQVVSSIGVDTLSILSDLLGVYQKGDTTPLCSVIFARDPRKASQIYEHIYRDGYETVLVHEDMSDDEFKSNIELYRASASHATILVTTPDAVYGEELGIVEHAIIFHTPNDIEDLLYLIGRTGRFSLGNCTIFFGSDNELLRAPLVKLMNVNNWEIPEFLISGDHLNESSLSNAINDDKLLPLMTSSPRRENVVT